MNTRSRMFRAFLLSATLAALGCGGGATLGTTTSGPTVFISSHYVSVPVNGSVTFEGTTTGADGASPWSLQNQGQSSVNIGTLSGSSEQPSPIRQHLRHCGRAVGTRLRCARGGRSPGSLLALGGDSSRRRIPSQSQHRSDSGITPASATVPLGGSMSFTATPLEM